MPSGVRDLWPAVLASLQLAVFCEDQQLLLDLTWLWLFVRQMVETPPYVGTGLCRGGSHYGGRDVVRDDWFVRVYRSSVNIREPVRVFA